MYVFWLVEFVWRIFIQGPLLLIKFFTKNINKLLTLYIFKGGSTTINNPAIEALITYSFFVTIGSMLIILVYIYHLLRILVNNDILNPKIQIINATKHFFKILIILIVFPLIMYAALALFATIAGIIERRFNAVDKVSGVSNWNIAEMLYRIITNADPSEKVDKNFLIPNDISKIDTMNLIVSIALVLSFSGFLLWIIWSIFQKLIEIFFMYLSFPISLAFSQDSYEIRWKIWIREILNKLLIVFTLILFFRVFIYFFYFTFNNHFNKVWNNQEHKLYLSLILTLALGSSIVFMTKLISHRNKEHVGILSSHKSFKQTTNFIKKTKSITFDQINHIPSQSINYEIQKIRSDISQYKKNNVINYQSLKKVKIFNK